MLSQSAVPALQKVISVCTTRLTTTADIESVIVLLSRGGLSAAGLIQILGISQSAIPTLQKVISVGTTWLKNADLESVTVVLRKGYLLLLH